jgi:UMF1 family MFS transporter
MNAYLPMLARESPEVLEILHEIQSKDNPPSSSLEDTDPSTEHSLPQHPEYETANSDADVPLIQRLPPSEEVEALKVQYDAELSRATSRISSLGIALGYGAGIALLIVALIPVTLLHGSTFALRLAIGLSGVWWALFSIPAALWLPSGPGGKRVGADVGMGEWVDDEVVGGQGEREWSTRREIVGAWKRLGNMLRWREIKKLRNTFKYLAAWFLLSDGKPTSPATGIPIPISLQASQQ